MEECIETKNSNHLNCEFTQYFLTQQAQTKLSIINIDVSLTKYVKCSMELNISLGGIKVPFASNYDTKFIIVRKVHFATKNLFKIAAILWVGILLPICF